MGAARARAAAKLTACIPCEHEGPLVDERLEGDEERVRALGEQLLVPRVEG